MNAAADCNVENSNQESGTACECLPGFEGDIIWSGDTTSSTCTPTSCSGVPDQIANGDVTKSNGDRHGSVATFVCNDGFKLVGTASINCSAPSANASWPVAATCDATECALPDSGFGTGFEADFSAANKHGSVASFICDAGFKLTGTQSVTCSAQNADSEWPIPDTTPCTPTNCANRPQDPRDGNVTFNNGDNHNSVATFTCKSGFKLNGTATLQCTAPNADAEWPPPTATPTCIYDGSNSNLDTQGRYANCGNTVLNFVGSAQRMRPANSNCQIHGPNQIYSAFPSHMFSGSLPSLPL